MSKTARLQKVWPLSGYRSHLVLDVVGIAGFIALGALVRFPLPFSPVPVTLQTFAVLVAAYAVSTPRATAGILLHISLGCLGVPLFAVSAGATLGYLVAFALVPWVASKFRHPAAGMTVSTLLIYVLGAAWLCLWLRLTPWQAMAIGVAPFIPGDLLKLAAAYRLVRWWRC